MKLTCFYMGRSAAEIVTESELRDIWTLVEMSENIGKTAGRGFEDEDGPKLTTDCPLDWKDGKATQMGCGSWWGGVDEDLIPICDDLLVRAGLPKLTVVDANLKATFDVEGVNSEQLDALDRAEWRLSPLTADELAAWEEQDSQFPDADELD